MPETVNVRGASDSLYEGMTKEQIYAAIVEAVEGGTIGDIDTGFVTIIKEINKNIGLQFWVGTTAEFNALTEKADNVLYIKTDDTSAADINAAIAAIQDGFSNIEAALAGLAPTMHASTSTDYGLGTANNYGHVKLISDITSIISYPDGKALSAAVGYGINQRIMAVENVTNDTGWQFVTSSMFNTGWSAGTVAPQYRRIGNHVYVRGQAAFSSSAVTNYNIFILPEGYRPSRRATTINGNLNGHLWVMTGAEDNNVKWFSAFDQYSGQSTSNLQGETINLSLDFFTD